MILNIDVTNILSQPQTNTTVGIAAGSSVSTNVVNTAGLTTNDFVVIGNLGDEASELQSIGSITDADTLVVATVALAHPSGTPLQKALYNQISLEKSSDGVSWSVLTTINIKGDQKLIDYNDVTGLTSDFYRFRFYNSTTTTYSGYSNAFSVADDPSPVDIIISNLISEIGTEYDNLVTKQVMFNALADVDLKIAREIIKTNKEFYKTSIDMNIVSGTTEYALPAHLISITEVMVGYTSGTNQVRSQEVPLEYGLTSEPLDGVYHSSYRKESDGSTYLVIRREPTQNVTAGITVSYVTKPSRILNTTDTLLTPQPMLYIDLLKDGVKELIYMDYKSDPAKAQMFGQRFRLGLRDLLAITNTYDFTPGVRIISDELSNAMYTY